MTDEILVRLHGQHVVLLLAQLVPVAVPQQVVGRVEVLVLLESIDERMQQLDGARVVLARRFGQRVDRLARRQLAVELVLEIAVGLPGIGELRVGLLQVQVGQSEDAMRRVGVVRVLGDELLVLGDRLEPLMALFCFHLARLGIVAATNALQLLVVPLYDDALDIAVDLVDALLEAGIGLAVGLDVLFGNLGCGGGYDSGLRTGRAGEERQDQQGEEASHSISIPPASSSSGSSSSKSRRSWYIRCSSWSICFRSSRTCSFSSVISSLRSQ